MTALLLAFCVNAAAQYSPDTTNAVGESALAVYKVGDIDNVNPVNGNLYINLPLLTYPQRGHSLGLSFRIYSNDKQWTVNTTGYTQNPDGLPTGAWALSGGNGPGVFVARDQQLAFGTDYISISTSGGSGYSAWTLNSQIEWNSVTTPDGGKHYYSDQQNQSCSQGSCPAVANNYGTSYPALDASGYILQNYEVPGAILDREGVLYTLGNGSPVVETTKDPSGNQIIASISGWQDTLK